MATFSEAFASARKGGKKTFTWKGKSYTTQTRDEANAASKRSPKPRPVSERPAKSAPKPRAASERPAAKEAPKPRAYNERPRSPVTGAQTVNRTAQGQLGTRAQRVNDWGHKTGESGWRTGGGF